MMLYHSMMCGALCIGIVSSFCIAAHASSTSVHNLNFDVYTFCTHLHQHILMAQRMDFLEFGMHIVTTAIVLFYSASDCVHSSLDQISPSIWDQILFLLVWHIFVSVAYLPIFYLSIEVLFMRLLALLNIWYVIIILWEGYTCFCSGTEDAFCENWNFEDHWEIWLSEYVGLLKLLAFNMLILDWISFADAYGFVTTLELFPIWSNVQIHVFLYFSSNGLEVVVAACSTFFCSLTVTVNCVLPYQFLVILRFDDMILCVMMVTNHACY